MTYRMKPTGTPGIYKNDLGANRVSYTVRYRGPTETQHTKTFRTLADAKAFKSQTDSARARGALLDPRPGRTTLAAFVETWLPAHTVRPRTRESYSALFRLHILPELGDYRLSDLTTPVVRQWRSDLGEQGTGSSTIAHAYRALRTALNVAVADGLIVTNPCTIKGAGADRAPQRRPAPLEHAVLVADSIEPRYRAFVLLAATSGLRWGELAGLARRHIDVGQCTVRVERTLTETAQDVLDFGDPKTDAGRRTVTIPASTMAEVEKHLDRFVEAHADALVFTGGRGGLLRRRNFARVWKRAVHSAEVPYFRPHQLRHLAATMAADSGASLRSLMIRIGHSSTAAAVHYQHASPEADRAIADAVETVLMKVGIAEAARTLAIETPVDARSTPDV